MQIDWIWLYISLPIPHVLSWGELPAFWMIMGGLTLIYAELQVIATCDFSTHKWRKEQPSWILLLACSACVFLWPWAAYMVTKHWRSNVRANKRRSQRKVIDDGWSDFDELQDL